MHKYLVAVLLVLNCLLPTLSWADDDEDTTKVNEANALLLKDEEPLKVNPQLPVPQRVVNLRLVQREVLTINLPDDTPEIDTEPVEE